LRTQKNDISRGSSLDITRAERFGAENEKNLCIKKGQKICVEVKEMIFKKLRNFFFKCHKCGKYDVFQAKILPSFVVKLKNLQRHSKIFGRDHCGLNLSS
jgi:hypothetical protein